MATDEPTFPPDCDEEIFENGTQVFRTHSIPPNKIEEWVKKVAELSGQRVDWHFAGGRACVLALGDLEKVEAAIKVFMPEHDRLLKKAYEEEGL